DIGLQSQEGYFQRMEDLIAYINQDPEVRLPGERRFGLRRQAEYNGISISDDLHKQLKELAQ
ncbi:MAG: Ldh family oxidoreductase, partial [Burkholderiaceae bacterium]